ncbi:hypothetical protein [Actinoplanes couchii]|uniref:Uncharacterized protein n=1 Tax=Actinoplanes couchii TaxID=403638 RepID=A0ABQ3XKM9_9ACTN|nr:hypothetical protein [Actinoplanes couchii]MDR6319553.1 hypothetical protein [Actinoplanes couchii]GID59057.1 hypothetical protein Aco03nite_074610 [Actinoplanes couchii]
MWTFWRRAYEAGTWRRIGYAIIAPPLHLISAVQVLTGRTAAAADRQRRLARGLTGDPQPPNAPGEVSPMRVLAGALGGVGTGVLGWLVLQYLALHIVMNVGYPVRRYVGDGPWGLRLVSRTDSEWVGEYVNAWGGPTLAGVWAVHAGLVMVLTVPILLWAMRGLTRLQGRVIHRADATPPR